jgi:Zn-dependent protease with chaperone function
VIGFKWLQLSGGGKKVAGSLGGTRINPNTNNVDEKRILNVVEEMALASGMPVPSVYLLKGEKGINAFAAGSTPADAVIGVTQGALDQFNREQLQGVVAHEFSHILNGDMRLNLRLIAMLSGIVFVATAGRLIMHAGGGGYGRHSYSSRRSGDMRIVLAGLAIVAVGWLGSFFAGLIKSAISRQREFLADASAVQFTRNPQGIADALKIIGGYNSGSQVFSAKADEASHLFISNALGQISQLFATHPPLSDRIRKIEAGWDGKMIHRELKVAEPANAKQNKKKEEHRKRQQRAAMAAAAAVASRLPDAQFSMPGDINNTRNDINAIPATLSEQAHEPFGAIALVYALLLSEEEAVQAKQLNTIKQTGIAGLSIQSLQLLPDIQGMDKTFRIPLLELAMPALKCMSGEQYKHFKKALLLIIRADNRFELFEWCLFQLVRHYLAPEFEKQKPAKAFYKKSDQVADEYCLVLSMLAHHGQHADEKTLGRAFNRGSNTAGLYSITLLAKEKCLLDDFTKAVNKLANCYPLLKPKLLKGLADCARHDGKISVEESEIIASVAAVIDCPTPELLKNLGEANNHGT